MSVSYHFDFDKANILQFAFRQIDGFREELPRFGINPKRCIFVEKQRNMSIVDYLKEIPSEELKVPARTVLLEAGRKADCLYLVVDGILRESYNHDGKDITLQFFFENHCVASIESFYYGTESQFSIETITASTVRVYRKPDLLAFMNQCVEFQQNIADFALRRMIDYSHLFLSRIKDTPQERYEHLVAEHPEIVSRVPQHFIASFLGITAVSVSRIRSRKS